MLFARQVGTIGIVALAVLAGCDIDDGRTLDPPTAPPPIVTAPTTTVPVDGAIGATAVPGDAVAQTAMQLYAPWPDGVEMPDRHTCAGESISPAMSWTNVPVGTLELVLTLTDIDAGMTTLWVVDGIAPTTVGFGEGAIPAEAFERPNASGGIGYEAPCPPVGEPHLVQFTLHALNQQLEVADDATADEVISFLNQTAVDQSSVSAIVTRTD